jgi:hypothetical protein
MGVAMAEVATGAAVAMVAAAETAVAEVVAMAAVAEAAVQTPAALGTGVVMPLRRPRIAPPRIRPLMILTTRVLKPLLPILNPYQQTIQQ